MATYRCHTHAPSIYVVFLVLTVGALALLPQGSRAQADFPAAVYEITGGVWDADHVPLADATVTLFDADGSAVDAATSDPDGAYAFTSLSAGDYVIVAAHECCIEGRASVAVHGTDTSHEAPDIVLQPRQPVASADAVILSGVVEDVQSEERLAGVVLAIDNYYSTGEGEKCTDGYCTVSPGGYQFFEVTTDADGEFSVEINKGEASVRATLAGYDYTHGQLSVQENRTVTVPMQQSSDSTVRLFGTLKSDAGTPIADGWVSVYPDYSYSCPPNADCAMPVSGGASSGEWYFEPSNPSYNSTQAKSDGSWEMQVTAGKVIVSAYAPEHIEAQKSVAASSGGSMEVKLTLRAIPPDSVTLKGRVTDSATGDPIEFADVNAENQQWGTWASTQTDENGDFELRTKPGYTILTVSAYMFYYTPCYAEGQAEPASEPQGGSSGAIAPRPSCEPGQRDADYFPALRSMNPGADDTVAADVALKARPAPSSEFKGYVLNATSGDVIEGVSVTFFNEQTRDWGSATTGEDGSYKIKVHAGYYSIRVYKEGYFDGVANAEIAADESIRLPDFELTPGQKRYGYWGCCAYAVMDGDARADYGPGAPPPMSGPGARSESPPVPSEGKEAYVGAEGNLGEYTPYEESSQRAGGKSPGIEIPLVVATAALVGLLRRRRA